MKNKLLEVSLVDNKQEFSISSLVWEDPAAWGILFVDLAKFVAETYSKEHHIDANDALARIFEGIQAELTSDEDSD